MKQETKPRAWLNHAPAKSFHCATSEMFPQLLDSRLRDNAYLLCCDHDHNCVCGCVIYKLAYIIERRAILKDKIQFYDLYWLEIAFVETSNQLRLLTQSVWLCFLSG